MSQTAKAQEPSIEEILASIRRIIADEETTGQVPKRTEPPGAAASPRPGAPAPELSEASGTGPAFSPPGPAASRDEIDAMIAQMHPPAPTSNGKDHDDGVADVLDLTPPMAAPEPPVFRTVEERSDVFFNEEPAEPEPAADAYTEERARTAVGPAEGSLMSSATSAAVDAAFNSLAHTVLSQNARTLEDLVTEMMRPMLKTWLDNNLPGLVERVVRAEIERVSRGRS